MNKLGQLLCRLRLHKTQDTSTLRSLPSAPFVITTKVVRTCLRSGCNYKETLMEVEER